MDKTLIPRCLTCKHWKQKTNYEGDYNVGKCYEMQTNSLVDIELHTGWDGGYVSSVDTDQKFGCILHEPKSQE